MSLGTKRHPVGLRLQELTQVADAGPHEFHFLDAKHLPNRLVRKGDCPLAIDGQESVGGLLENRVQDFVLRITLEDRHAIA